MSPYEYLNNSRNKLDSMMQDSVSINVKLRSAIDVASRFDILNQISGANRINNYNLGFEHTRIDFSKFLESISLPRINRYDIDHFFSEQHHVKIKAQIAHRDFLRSGFIAKEISLNSSIEDLTGDLGMSSDKFKIFMPLEREMGDYDKIIHSIFQNIREEREHTSLGEKIAYQLSNIYRSLIELKAISNVIQVLTENIGFLLAKFKKSLRNLRLFFKRQHSFHFKNLDDYHATGFNPSVIG